jgi:signal transduction histidine kinase/CheY-like chemotaxis protein
VDFRPAWAKTNIVQDAIPAAIQNGVWSGETAFISRDGREIPVSQVMIAHKTADGVVEFLSVIARDISERKHLEAQVHQAQKMEAVGQLAGGIAHDFNNLLTAILGNLSLVLSNLPRPSPDGELLEAAEKAALRAAELTSQLLGFSRRSMLRPQPTNLNTIIEETVRLLRRAIDPRIVIDVRVADQLWTVQADPGQMNQVLVNLCLNARDAMQEGGNLLLETSTLVVNEDHARRHLEARRGEFVRLRVADTGHGMPPEVHARIFEPFFTTKGPGKGTGLGLAMVFGIVKQHQGWIECKSEVKKGTMFDIYLPRSKQGQEAAPPGEKRSPPSRGHELILLADDELMIRNLGRAILERQGYQVLLAQDGQEAVELYQREKGAIDLVILDLTMPRLSGREAFQQLVEIDPQVRVLFASGYSADFVEAEQEQMLGFIGKPYRPDDLTETVRAVLDRSRDPSPRLSA